ncbi:GAF domain-containing protein [Kangiella spongicola]|jgi:L-methionine (R)-S-oxide reductase|uniref:GAF domain-containing protein n=1 Tax=Kangiella spongicola TaxID=796379 RepID=A0A318D1D0_9GAMM|nr:GAF domain-containing protein [Kangiella spongicola]MBV36319.1 GAF domain-containing protein [Rickettsiales bacterium]PXF62593.1 GAF domain-containing protein [Kangiella spongicola]
MFELDPNQVAEYRKNKPEYYRQLALQLGALLGEDRNVVTNMAQTSAFIFQMIPDLNWAGFYVTNPEKAEHLILGPYQGKVACVHIPFGRGVCGTAAETQQTQLVEDVNAFEGHIACDAASLSEVVVPLLVNEEVKGVLDIDSPISNRFDEEDAQGFESLARVFLEKSDL